MSRKPTRNDENWALARSIQLTPCSAEVPAGAHGVVSAEPHATGWFISARFDPELSAADIADFAEFTVVRTYLLLQQGTRCDAWEAGEDGVWRAYCVGSELNELVPVPA